MKNRIRKFVPLFKAMGLRWVVFRIGYSLRIKSGLIKIQAPAYPWGKYKLKDRLMAGIPKEADAYAQWRLNFSKEKGMQGLPYLPETVPWDAEQAMKAADALLEGRLTYFGHLERQIGFPPDWLLDPIENQQYAAETHWSQIPDYGSADIKFVWEANRFGMVYTLVRAYATTRQERYAAAFWEIIESWMQANPPGFGPNWKDGQEAALRLTAACFGYFAFLDTLPSSSERISQFTLFAAAHAQRIFQNLDFARYTHSNHTISEAFGLWLAGSLFPELRGADKYRATGRRILETEMEKQFFADGGYAMYSLNYQRHSLHLYLAAIRLGERLGQPFPEETRARFARSIDFLVHMLHCLGENLPCFGSNDGSLVLPLNNCDYGDFRPLVQAGHYLIHKKRLYPPGPWDEDLFWLFGPDALDATQESAWLPERQDFPDAGLYVIEGNNSYASVRCVDYRSRPSHADQLHVDLRRHGKMITCDAGTYLYNGPGIWKNGLAGTAVHNTVMVDGQDQMTPLSRITWVNWAGGQVLAGQVMDHIRVWQGQHDGYRRLTDAVEHRRSVMALPGDRWLIVDHLSGLKTHCYRLQWLLGNFPYLSLEQGTGVVMDMEDWIFKFQVGSSLTKSHFSIARGNADSTRGWQSTYYARRDPAVSLVLEAEAEKAVFWTFVGEVADKIFANHGKIEIEYFDHTQVINFEELMQGYMSSRT